jgi:hypothetical protein
MMHMARADKYLTPAREEMSAVDMNRYHQDPQAAPLYSAGRIRSRGGFG